GSAALETPAAGNAVTPSSLVPSPAAPAPTVPAAPPLTRQQRGVAALALIHYPWRELGVNIAFLGPRPGYLGKTYPSQGRIEIYVLGNEPTPLLAYMVAHEVGHMVDWRYGTTGRRQAWKAARHIPAAMPWYGNAFAGGDDLGTPAGDFA